MPHTVWPTGLQTGTGDFLPRPLIPGIEPGGSRLGHPTKPALLIRDAFVMINELDVATEDFHALEVYLKLSQEEDLDPGLTLPVANISFMSDGTTNPDAAPSVEQLGKHLIGSIWTPAYVGIRVVERGAVVQWQMRIHLMWDVVEIPWMDWFFRWDYLDNVVNNDLEY